MAVEPLIIELSKSGRRAVRMPAADVPVNEPPADQLRDSLDWPEVSEIDVIRHYTRVSQKNHAIDINFYPLGSCTMKYNPKINEAVARYPGFACDPPAAGQPRRCRAHSSSCTSFRRAGRDLRILVGRACSRPPAPMASSPASSSSAPITTIAAIPRAPKILVPDSAHGTNPATAAMVGFQVVTIPSDDRGNVDIDAAAQARRPGHRGDDDHQSEYARALGRAHQGSDRRSSTTPAAWFTTTARTSMRSWVSSDRAISASTSCTSTCTRPFQPRTAAAVPAQVRSVCERSWSKYPARPDA